MLNRSLIIASAWILLAFDLDANSCESFMITAPVSSLLSKHADEISILKKEAQSEKYGIVPTEDVFYLRYCLEFEGKNKKDGEDGAQDKQTSLDLLKENLAWRNGEGSRICELARLAVAAAMDGEKGQWNNAPVRNGAPHAAIVNQYISQSEIVTTTTRSGDLVYCIRAGQIDDVGLMSKLTADEMSEFFLYCKEVNAIVADVRSESSDHLVYLVTANDLSGTSLTGASSFRKALSAASKKASTLYPTLAGPTLLLNLPILLTALAKLFTPLFPPDVRAKLRFEKGPLNDLDDLSELFQDGPARESFMNDLDRLIYTKK